MQEAFKPVQQRWDAFLTKIEERFHETLSEAETILPQVLDYQNFDTAPINVAWQAISNQAKELLAKIGETWRTKVSGSFENIKEAEEEKIKETDGSLDEMYQLFNKLYNVEYEKGVQTAFKLERELRAYEVRILAATGRKLQQKAAEILSKGFTCSQCKAPLPVLNNFFRSYYQTCDYCQTVNTFEPGTIARNVEHFAVPAIAEEKALSAYFDFFVLEHKYKGQRSDEPLVISAQKVIDAYAIYIDIYLKARIEIIPEYEKRYKKDRAAKIEHLRKWSLSDDFARDFTFLSKEQIAAIFEQVAEVYLFDDLEESETLNTVLIKDLKDHLPYFLEEITETFGIALDKPEEKTMQEAIEWLFANREKIRLGWNVSEDLEWYGYFGDEDWDEDDYDDED